MTMWLAERAALVIGKGEGVDAIARALRDAGATLARAQPVVAGDAASDGGAAALFDRAEQEAGVAFSILVQAPLIAPTTCALEFTFQEWRRRQEGDLDFRFFCAGAFARRRIAAGAPGVIVQLVSRAADDADEGDVAAAATAGGIDNLVKTLAVEWARDGVRVNAICSHLLAASAPPDPDRLQALGALSAYLCSDYAAYVTGCTMGVNEM